MVKSIITTLVATTMLTSVATAEVSKKDMDHAIAIGNSAVCNTLDKGVAFNKRSLSAFDKCWINIHKADEDSGTSDGFFWVRVGDKIIDTKITDLVNAGSKPKAIELVKTKVMNQIIIEYRDRIIGVTQDRYDTVVRERDRLLTEINNAPNVTEALSTLSQMQTDIDELENIRRELESAGFTGEAFEEIEDLVASYGRILRDLDTLSEISDAEIEAIMGAIPTNITGNVNTQVNNINQIDSIAVIQFTLSKSINEQSGNALHTVIGASLEDAVQKALEKAYDRGFNDGFDAGFKAGFKAGVDSVTQQ